MNAITTIINPAYHVTKLVKGTKVFSTTDGESGTVVGILGVCGNMVSSAYVQTKYGREIWKSGTFQKVA